MTTMSTLLLTQPLNINDINIKFDDDDEEEALPQETMTIDTMIDDKELLAILGLNSSSLLLDWDEVPELSEGEEENHHDNKRKWQDDDDDILAQFDFEEVNLIYQTTHNTPRNKK